MGLFGKKKEEKCCAAESTVLNENADIEIKVLGGGCAKCNALESTALAALAELGVEARLEHVTDFAKIAAYGVMSTPALMLNGKLLSAGRVLNKDEAKSLIQSALSEK